MRGVRHLLCIGLLPVLFVFGSGFAPPQAVPFGDEPAAVAEPVLSIRDVTMAELIAKEKDRTFDYSFSYRFVKRGDRAYYIRYSSLYRCDRTAVTKLLDNAFVYWMYIDDGGNLWFCVRGSEDIASGEIVERRAVYRYCGADGRYALVKKESDTCTFSNRFYRSNFLYWERGWLKACDTNDFSVRLLGRAQDASVCLSPDETSVYYTDNGGGKIRFTGLDGNAGRKTALKLSDFPLETYTFEEAVVDNLHEPPALYRLTGLGYDKLGDISPSPAWLSDAGTVLFAAADGICAIVNPNRAGIRTYSLADRSWRRAGGDEPADAYGYNAGVCWFYTCSAPVRLYVFARGGEKRYTFGGWINGCNSVRISNGKAFIFQYDEDWLTYVFDMGTGELSRIAD